MPSTLSQTPLHSEHIALGARMVEFTGYDLPVQYQGVIAESHAVRQAAGMFDVSHMARLNLDGANVVAFLEWVTSNDITKLVDGQGQYSLLPNAAGGTVDDIIVYQIGEEAFKMVVNAANHAKDLAHLRGENRFAVGITDVTETTAMIAVQGPSAVEILANMAGYPDEVRQAPMFAAFDERFGGIECFAARSGYTGEDGYELQCAAADAPKLWRALLKAGVVPCGLGARDVLRVEAGLPLYGHELTDELSPIAAGLGWVVSKTKAFLGSETINAARTAGTPIKLQGVRLEGKRLPVPGMRIWADGQDVGVVSSGIYSPSLECGVAFAFVEARLKPELPCEIEIRGSREPATLVNKRFLRNR